MTAHEPTPRAKVPAARVDYSAHLFRVARTDAMTWAERRRASVAIWGGVIFLAVAFLVWLVRGGEVDFPVPVFAGVLAALLAGAGVFAAHLLYLSPRKLCALKQRQLDAERRNFAAALEKEKQATQLAQAERDVLKARLEERPLRALELREEIDQLIAEGETLLDSVEGTMIGEAELWFDDVERFAKRHLNPSQYDRLHATTPPDLEAQVKFHRAASEQVPITEEEFAVAEEVVRLCAGLRELRKGIGREGSKAA
jgi:hypothetical protein